MYSLNSTTWYSCIIYHSYVTVTANPSCDWELTETQWGPLLHGHRGVSEPLQEWTLVQCGVYSCTVEQDTVHTWSWCTHCHCTGLTYSAHWPSYLHCVKTHLYHWVSWCWLVTTHCHPASIIMISGSRDQSNINIRSSKYPKFWCGHTTSVRVFCQLNIFLSFSRNVVYQIDKIIPITSEWIQSKSAMWVVFITSDTRDEKLYSCHWLDTI